MTRNRKSRQLERRRFFIPAVWGTLMLLCLVGYWVLGEAQPAQPHVTTTRPTDGATGVPRDDFISADVYVPNGGIDPATLNDQSVYLYRTDDLNQQHIPSVLNTSGGGDVIVLRPVNVLDANTNYTFVVSSNLQDITGVSFMPFQMSFTRGTATGGTDSSIGFQKLVQSSAPAKSYTCVTIGPDGKLYASAATGEIVRFDINQDGTLGAAQTITSLQTANNGNRLLIGLEFDLSAMAGNLILWVSHSAYTFSNGPDWTGKISRLSGDNLEFVEDYVVGLPRSTRDHVTNQLDFGPDGALYFLQGSNSAMGAPDSAWNFRPEHLLNAAVLRLDIAGVSSRPVDVKTEEGGTYDPYAAYAPLTIFAHGIRNAYDLLWHRNGSLYVPTNGSASGGATPQTPTPLPLSCANRVDGTYTGPAVPGINTVSQTMNDYLFRVVESGYYGHPNPTRCEWVLNGGNPTSGADPGQVTQYPVGTQPDRNWRGFSFDFGQHYSPNGIIEYKNGAFDGALIGRLLVVRYSGGDDLIILTPGPSGDIIASRTGTSGLTNFTDPLDVVENPTNGMLYLVEYGGQKIYLLRPLSPPTAPIGLSATAVSSSQINLAWRDTSNDESGFKIESSLDGSAFTHVATVSAGVTNYNDTGLAELTTYYYRVRAYNGDGDSAYTNTASATTPAPPLNAPSGLAATAVSSSQINLGWIDNSNDESGFKVERSPDGSAFTQIATVSADVTNYGDTGLAGMTTYYYRVRATNGNGDSAYTNTASATTPAPPLNAPSGLTATTVSSSQINLAWTDSASNESGFRIERKTGATGIYAEIVTVGANVTSYNNTGLSSATTYYYRVRAYNSNGDSGYSNEASAATAGMVGTGTGLKGEYYDNKDFTNLKLTRTDASVNFNWGTGSPHSSIQANTFSVRWTGFVEPRYSQTYTFYTTTDDGVRLWVNNQLIINKWINQSAKEWASSPITLTANQRYSIHMEYYENSGNAVAKLSWSSLSQTKQIIPKSRLYP